VSFSEKKTSSHYLSRTRVIFAKRKYMSIICSNKHKGFAFLIFNIYF